MVDGAKTFALLQEFVLDYGEMSLRGAEGDEAIPKDEIAALLSVARNGISVESVLFKLVPKNRYFVFILFF